jgi:RHS repeat-associated protein
VAPKRVDFAYNQVGQVSQIDRFADLNGTQSVADSAYAYRADGSLQGLTYSQATGPSHTNPVALTGYTWTYDTAGRITGFNSPDGTTTYSYDAAGQLQSAVSQNPTVQPSTTYTYDANGNRTMSGYLTGPDNRVTSDGTYNYQYDHEGHRIKQTEIATGKTTSYVWDFRGRLTDITYQASSYINSHVYRQIHYNYDGLDRLVLKEIDANGDGVYETSESYVYDGENVVLVFNSAGSVTNRYLQGPGVDQVLADEQVSTVSQTPNTVLWALSDNQGTVRDWAQRNTTTGQTQIVDHIVYDAYGQIVSQTNPQTHLAATNKIRFGYTGQIWDADAKLYYYRARWYDPHIGKFTSEDPLGFGAGDTNVQRYVGNSPTNYTDPSGMDKFGRYGFDATGETDVPLLPGRRQSSPGWPQMLQNDHQFSADVLAELNRAAALYASRERKLADAAAKRAATLYAGQWTGQRQIAAREQLLTWVEIYRRKKTVEGPSIEIIARQFGFSPTDPLGKARGDSYKQNFLEGISCPNSKTGIDKMKIAHFYIRITSPDGTQKTYSYHPDEWPKADNLAAWYNADAMGNNLLDANLKRLARIWINDPADLTLMLMLNGQDPYFLEYESFVISRDAAEVQRMMEQIAAWQKKTKVGIDQGSLVEDKSNPNNNIGDEKHVPNSGDLAYYWVYGQNCGWWAYTMAKDSGIKVPPTLLNGITVYNGGTGITQRMYDNQRFIDRAGYEATYKAWQAKETGFLIGSGLPFGMSKWLGSEPIAPVLPPPGDKYPIQMPKGARTDRP